METDELSLLIQHVVQKNPSKIAKLAAFAGKRCSTLLREADPHDKRAKMGIETLLAIMEASHDVRPLEYLARQMGLELVKLHEKGEGSDGKFL